jgi:ATP-binding cassette subfamily C protein
MSRIPLAGAEPASVLYGGALAFAAALLLSPLVALTALAGGAAVVAAYASSRRRSLAHGTMLTALNAELHQQLADTLGALRLIRSFGAQDRSLAALDAIEREAADERVAHQAMVARGQALLLVAGAILAAVLVWLGIRQWHIAPIVLLPLIALFARVLPLLDGLQAHWQSWRAAQPALGATLALIGAAEDADETADVAARTAPAPDREIALKGVSLRHAGRARPALDRVDLVLPLGSATVLAGASGAGKSSVADILGGLIQPDTGALTLDGRALDPAERVAWRERVAYVQQEPILFHATIRQNLVWAVPDADETRMVAALRGAAAGFVLDLPLGLDTVVGEAGRQLSGGERQRIVLARALLREPVLMILDEAASALDPASEAEIAAAVGHMRGRITLLIIGHRGALTALADRQAHLAEGRISTTDAKVAAA